MNWISTGNKILITGFSGLVGSTFMDTISEDKIVGISRGNIKSSKRLSNNFKLYQIDLSKTSLNQLEKIVTKSNCDLILHFATLTGDRCQQNPQMAEQINWGITYKLALICKKMRIPLGFCSTADVFPRFGGPYAEDDPTGVIYDNATGKLNIYSWTKYRAENDIIKVLFPNHLGFIFRIAYPYNPSYILKPGTVVTCFNNLARGEIWTAVRDMNINPTPTKDIVSAINMLILKKVWKKDNPVFHIAQKDILTSLEIAQICSNELIKRGVKINIKKQIKVEASAKFFITSPRQIPGGIRVNKILEYGIKIPTFKEEVKYFPLP